MSFDSRRLLPSTTINQVKEDRGRFPEGHDKARSLIVDCGASWSVDFRVLAFFS
jgi:hypothetical protein